MKVKVFHRVDPFGDNPAQVHVATVERPGECHALDALEYAWMCTQNVSGSWSRGPLFEDGSRNADYSANIERHVPLPEHDGKVFGLRSSMVGDRFEMEDRAWLVAGCGFDEIAGEQKAPPPLRRRSPDECARAEGFTFWD